MFLDTVKEKTIDAMNRTRSNDLEDNVLSKGPGFVRKHQKHCRPRGIPFVRTRSSLVLGTCNTWMLSLYSSSFCAFERGTTMRPFFRNRQAQNQAPFFVGGNLEFKRFFVIASSLWYFVLPSQVRPMSKTKTRRITTKALLLSTFLLLSFRLLPVTKATTSSSSPALPAGSWYAGRGVYWKHRPRTYFDQCRPKHMRRRRLVPLKETQTSEQASVTKSRKSNERENEEILSRPFRELDERPSQRKPLMTSKTQQVSVSTKIKGKTLARMLTEKFQQDVLFPTKKENGKQHYEIHTGRLLQAFKDLALVQRQVGQRANAQELLNNIQKVERVCQQAPASARVNTVSALLTYETRVLHCHESEGRLQDPSAAMGLLWLRRALEFQQQLFALVLTIPTSPGSIATTSPVSRFPSPTGTMIMLVKGRGESLRRRRFKTRELRFDNENDGYDDTAVKYAAYTSSRRQQPGTSTSPNVGSSPPLDATQASLMAYAQTMQKHHGWKMQQIYSLALRTSTPSREELLRSMGGYASSATMTQQQEEQIVNDLHELVETWEPVSR